VTATRPSMTVPAIRPWIHPIVALLVVAAWVAVGGLLIHSSSRRSHRPYTTPLGRDLFRILPQSGASNGEKESQSRSGRY
jgi:hypothetical protein